MWNEEFWEDKRDSCDLADQQIKAVFDATLTQVIHNLGK